MNTQTSEQAGFEKSNQFVYLNLINHKTIKMKKILLLLILFASAYSFAQETTGKVRTQDKYSKAILEINRGYLVNDFKAFDKYFAENGNYDCLLYTSPSPRDA